ncbi:hypothetical protein HUW46_08365 [Amycolatopsis sp. CA-230715]|nr:hypothetical protein HUW46_08365 [Amycolatopsis sp. CA-230715]
MRTGKRSLFQKLLAVFAGISLSVVSANAAPASAAGNEEFKAFNMWFDVTALSNTNECIPAWVTARYRDPASGSDSWTRLVRTNNNGCETDPEHLQKYGDFQNTWSAVNLMGGPKPGQRIYWKDLTSLTLTVLTPNTPPGRQKCVSVNKYGIWGLDTNNYWHELVNTKFDWTFCDGHNDLELFVNH